MTPNRAQTEAWNGGESVHYVSHADRYDRQLAPFTDALFGRARIHSSEAVLDIGCGCGVTTLRAARAARVAVGLDISHPLVAIATDRARSVNASNASFVVADAQTYSPGDGVFDVLISQFGLMFFDDPGAAFARLRRALRPGGRLVFVSWQGLLENDWLMVVGRVVERYARLPGVGGLGRGPGMFALESPDEMVDLLTATGFSQVTVEPVATTILLGGGGHVDDALDFLTGMGMVRGLLAPLGSTVRDAAIDEIRAALARHRQSEGIRLGAAGWIASATNGPGLSGRPTPTRPAG